MFRLLRAMQGCVRARRVCAKRAEQCIARHSVIVTAPISPISDAGAVDLHRLQIGRAADELAGVAAGLFEQHVEGAAEAARLKAACWRSIAACSRSSRSDLTVLVHLIGHVRRRACRGAANI